MNNDSKNLVASLIKNNVKRSKIGRIRELFEEIEDAQLKGVRNIDLVSALNTEGLDLTLKTFENMLHRIRKERTGTSNTRTPVNDKGKYKATTMNHSFSEEHLKNKDSLGRESYPFFDVTDDKLKEWDDLNLPKLAKGLLVRYGISKDEYHSLNITVTSPTSINEIINTYCIKKEQEWNTNRGEF